MTTVSSTKVYALSAPLVAGTFTVPNVNVIGPFGDTARIMSIRRITVAGTPGTAVVANKILPTGAGAGAVWGLRINSNNALDTCVYQVSWENEYDPSQLLPQGGLLLNAQFNP